jgi:hypothetical protein
VNKSIPDVVSTELARVKAAPAAARPPSYGPLAFEGSGDLLVRTQGGVVRVDRATFGEAAADAPTRWPSAIASSPDSPEWTLAGVEERCDGPTLVARFEGADRASVEAPLPLLVSPRCTPATDVNAVPLGRSAQGHLIAVRGEILVIPAASPPRPALAQELGAASVEPGAGRAPGGAVIALPTARGTLVAKLKGSARAASARLWQLPEGASSCAPNDAADRIACVVGGAAVIYGAR